jgi:ribosomal protein S18 acetylase RimI-like enzyme
MLKIRELLVTEIDDFKQNIINDQYLFDAFDDVDLTSTRVYVAVLDDNIIGYIAYDKYTTYSACICFFYIMPKYRHNGYGKKILKKLIEKLKKHNSYIYGFVKVNNKIAYDFYKKYYQFYGTVNENNEIEVTFYLDERRFYNERNNT